MGRLDGKVALIIGGASGMGLIASQLSASEGAQVVLTDVSDDTGEQVAEKISNGRGRLSLSMRTYPARRTRRRWWHGLSIVRGSHGPLQQRGCDAER